jgi:hypothetical protein
MTLKLLVRFRFPTEKESNMSNQLVQEYCRINSDVYLLGDPADLYVPGYWEELPEIVPPEKEKKQISKSNFNLRLPSLPRFPELPRIEFPHIEVGIVLIVVGAVLGAVLIAVWGFGTLVVAAMLGSICIPGGD